MPLADGTSSGPKFNTATPLDTSRVGDFSREQLQNAAIIYQVGRRMGMSTRDIQIALITAMVESNLVNVDYGDRDSLGLFQQRPSQGWGTPAQVMDPVYAARKFFSVLSTHEDRWEVSMGQAAQAVQRSAFPERYDQRVADMRGLWPSVQQAAGESPVDMDGKPYNAFPGSEFYPDPFNLGTTPAATPSWFPMAGAQGVPLLTGSDGLTEASLTPSAHQMLGAWGMDNPVVGGGQPDDLISASLPLVSPQANQQVILPMAQEMGSYEKGVDGWRKAVIDAAMTALGQPYVWGGTSLSSGVDCSGLIYAAYARAGLSIPRVSYQQANFGERVSVGQLRPGDLYAWDNSSRNNGADHIALYIGNGKILEASKPGQPVRIRSLGAEESGWGVQINF